MLRPIIQNIHFHVELKSKILYKYNTFNKTYYK